MARKLTAGVLQGIAYRETMTVEWAGEEFEVEIRPLNNEEATRVEEYLQEGFNVILNEFQGRVTKKMNLDTKANLRGRKKADILTVALGTVDDAITEEVVEKEFPPKLVAQIAKRIREISGIGNQEQIEEESKEEPFQDADE